MEEIRKAIQYLRERDLYPDVKVIQGVSSDPEVMIDGRKVHNFCSANYLGLANDPILKKAVVEGIRRYGLHPTGSRLVSGTLDIHLELEKETAKFKDAEDSVIFTSGVLANIGSIPALVNLPPFPPSAAAQSVIRRFLGSEAEIFSDELNHGSIIDGIRLAKVKRTIYKHNDVEDLERALRRSRTKRKLVITDGVFSMDGDIAPLPKLIELSKKYGAMLMVDDAHATGVLGKHGKGTLEYFGLRDGIDIQMGTYSKAMGLLGGFVAGEKSLIDYLRIWARTYVFSGAIWGSIAYGALKAMEIVQKDVERRKRLLANSDYLRDGLKQRGFNTLTSKDTPIIPILIGKEEDSIRAARELFNEGIFAPAIRWPAVPKGMSRIRISVMSTHTQRQMDYFLNTMEKVAAKLHVIR